jgi:hypothetical protein
MPQAKGMMNYLHYSNQEKTATRQHNAAHTKQAFAYKQNAPCPPVPLL